MFTLKIKSKESLVPSYVNSGFIMNINDAELKGFKEDFLMNWESANKLFRQMIMRKEELNLEYMAIVDMVNMPPYREFEVKVYQEFK